MQELEQAVHTIQVRFGSQALARASNVPTVQPWPTGTAVIDRLSGIGGLPKGRLSVLQGRGTCGKTSLGLAFLGQATREFAQCVLLDPGQVFDPWALLPLQPQLEVLTVVRPPGTGATGEAAISLARAGAGFMLILLPPRVAVDAEPWLSSLCAAAERSGSIVVAVAEATPPALAHASSLTFGLEAAGWLIERGELAGLRARLRCLKNKVAAPGAETEIEIRYAFGATRFPKQPLRAAEQEEVPRWVATSAAV